MYPPTKSPFNQKKIIVAMMDWGLGHTTRCIPIIRQLQEQQCCITIAANLKQKTLLELELNDIEYLELEGYNINYSKKGRYFFLKLLLQLPKFLRRIRQEQLWIQKKQTTHHFQAVISDNRYGFYLHDVPSVLITHQLSPVSGKAPRFDYFIRTIHYRMIRKFQEVWVPDTAEEPSLSGSLSHPNKIPENTYYIGPQSRFYNVNLPTEQVKSPKEKYKVLAIISGPEPQRTILENILLLQMKNIEGKCILVRGLPSNDSHIVQNANIQIHQHLQTNELFHFIIQSDLVICRSGYSSIMDLFCLKRKALLIPTPGQTEQEYLAKELQKKRIYPFLQQEKFEINKALQIADEFPYEFPTVSSNATQEVISNFIEKI